MATQYGYLATRISRFCNCRRLLLLPAFERQRGLDTWWTIQNHEARSSRQSFLFFLLWDLDVNIDVNIETLSQTRWQACLYMFWTYTYAVSIFIGRSKRVLEQGWKFIEGKSPQGPHRHRSPVTRHWGPRPSNHRSVCWPTRCEMAGRHANTHSCILSHYFPQFHTTYAAALPQD